MAEIELEEGEIDEELEEMDEVEDLLPTVVDVPAPAPYRPPLQCRRCPKPRTFASLGALKDHDAAVKHPTPPGLVACDFCPKEFRSMFALNDHRLAVHQYEYALDFSVGHKRFKLVKGQKHENGDFTWHCPACVVFGDIDLRLVVAHVRRCNVLLQLIVQTSPPTRTSPSAAAQSRAPKALETSRAPSTRSTVTRDRATPVPAAAPSRSSPFPSSCRIA